MLESRIVSAAATALLLGVLPLVAAHGDEHESSGMGGMGGMDMGSHGDAATTVSNSTAAPLDPSYFRHSEYAGWMYAHIAAMTIAWVVIAPVGVMLSVAKSKLTIPVQFAFLIVNGLGVFTSVVYNASTPDLYKNNSHHPIGWIVTGFATAWTVLSLIGFYTKGSGDSERTPAAISSQNMAEYQRLQDFHAQQEPYRWSNDSGQGESLASSSRSPSSDDLNQKLEQLQQPQDEEDGEDDDGLSYEPEKRDFLHGTRLDTFLSRNVARFAVGRTLRILNALNTVLERTMLIHGYYTILTGFVVYGGIFHQRSELFSGLAHWIKGSIFFWYGLLTLGRWMGAFADYGWAWNIKPPHPTISRLAARMPSAEFTESFVIWFYGASNVWLEHLTAWGEAWSPTDFEHLSITFMFFGGGMLGMLIESSWIRDLLNTGVLLRKEDDAQLAQQAEEGQHQEWETPKTYRTSLNPMPGLVILLLGIMMSSHHQSSMVSTMLHSQWGSMFVGFAMARAVTYILLYLSPPKSHFPSRPPSELIASFCLVAGGLIFMASSKDTVAVLEYNDLDAMFIFTVTMGFSAALMAWTTVCFAIKGWAVRRVKRTALS